MESIDLNQEVSVVVRILPSGKEVDIDLPLIVTGKEVIDNLLNYPGLNIPRVDNEGNAYTYQLVSKGSGKQIAENMNLNDAGVRGGDTLLLTPVLVAG